MIRGSERGAQEDDMNCIGVLTGSGDNPSLNACIRSVVRLGIGMRLRKRASSSVRAGGPARLTSLAS